VGKAGTFQRFASAGCDLPLPKAVYGRDSTLQTAGKNLADVVLHNGRSTMTARTDDYDEIVRVIQLYIDGFNDNDIRKFEEAFQEDVWIFYSDADGVLHKNLLSESFERWAAPPSWGVVGRLISVTQVGDAAAVQLSLEAPSYKSKSYIDFHNLVRINGVWKITNKTATHGSRQVWSADHS
jgi:hypothetical protein